MPSLVKPVARRDLIGLEAVVVAAAVALMGEAVELRADLADLREHHLLVAAALVATAGFMKVRFTCTSKRRVPENGMSALSTWASSIISPVLTSLTRVEHRLRLHVVGGAALVAGAPFRRAALVVGRRQPRRRLRHWRPSVLKRSVESANASPICFMSSSP